MKLKIVGGIVSKLQYYLSVFMISILSGCSLMFQVPPEINQTDNIQTHEKKTKEYQSNTSFFIDIIPQIVQKYRIFKTKIVYVVDGDTVDTETGIRIRYCAVDTPERDEEGYAEATQANAKMVLGKDVWVFVPQPPEYTYGRLVAYLYVKQGPIWTNVSKYLVYNGYGEERYRYLDVDLPYRIMDTEMKILLYQENVNE